MKSNSDKRAGKPGTWTLSLIVRIQPPVFPALFVLTLIAIVCASNQLPLQAGVVERIVAVVNDELITNLEVQTAMEPIVEQYTKLYEGMELKSKLKEARKKVVEKLVSDRLILQEAIRIGIGVDKQEIEAYLDGVKSKFSSEEEFEQALEAKGMKIWDLKKQYKEQLLIKKTIRLKVKAETIITPLEVKQYYEAHKGEFIVPETAKIYQILLKKEKDTSAAKALQKAKGILTLLEGGEDFEELAGKHSEGPNASRGGYMGMVERGQMIEEINDVIFDLESGEISKIIETEIGFHIFKLESKTTSKARSLQDMQDAIKDILMNEKAQGIIDKWVGELKEKAYIDIK